jgi:hypothetical protein
VRGDVACGTGQEIAHTLCVLGTQMVCCLPHHCMQCNGGHPKGEVVPGLAQGANNYLRKEECCCRARINTLSCFDVVVDEYSIDPWDVCIPTEQLGAGSLPTVAKVQLTDSRPYAGMQVQQAQTHMCGAGNVWD